MSVVYPRVKRVAQALSQQVKAEHRSQYGKAREKREPPRHMDIIFSKRQHLAPGGHGRLDAKAQKRKPRLRQNGIADSKSGRNDYRRDSVGKQVDKKYFKPARADKFGRLHKFPCSYSQHLRAHEPCEPGPGGKPDYYHHIINARFKKRYHKQNEKE